MCLQRYCKTQNLVGHGVYIPRFLPQKLSWILFQYISKIRPLEVLFLQILHPGEEGIKAAVEFKNFLFCQNGKRMSAESICHSFASSMAKYGLNLGIRTYRHVAIHFARHHLKFPSMVQDSYLDLQAGHSTVTGSVHYGRESSELLTQTAELEHQFFLASTDWQNLFQSRFGRQ